MRICVRLSDPWHRSEPEVALVIEDASLQAALQRIVESYWKLGIGARVEAEPAREVHRVENGVVEHRAPESSARLVTSSATKIVGRTQPWSEERRRKFSEARKQAAQKKREASAFRVPSSALA